MHWLGASRLDRFVLRALKRVPNVGCHPVTAMTQHLLHAHGVVQASQTHPTEDDVYVSLLRLVRQGLVEKYKDTTTGGIRYRARIYRR